MIKIIITAASLILITIHLLFPQLRIDAITIGLFIVGILPWVTGIIESAKLPGGWEIRFRDLKTASDALPPSPQPSANRSQTLLDVAQLDANLALVYLRIEIEKRLRTLAANTQVSRNLPLIKLYRELQQLNVIDAPLFGGLQEIVTAGNKAAHGSRVEPSLRDWAMEYGPQILDVLDGILEKTAPAEPESGRLR